MPGKAVRHNFSRGGVEFKSRAEHLNIFKATATETNSQPNSLFSKFIIAISALLHHSVSFSVRNHRDELTLETLLFIIYFSEINS